MNGAFRWNWVGPLFFTPVAAPRLLTIPGGHGSCLTAGSNREASYRPRHPEEPVLYQVVRAGSGPRLLVWPHGESGVLSAASFEGREIATLADDVVQRIPLLKRPNRHSCTGSVRTE